MSERSADHDRRVLDAYDLVLDVEPRARTSFIRERFGADPALMREVERLAEAGERADTGVLADSAESYARPVLDDLDRRIDAAGAEMPGAMRAALSPRYRFEREIGRGGMAHVYLAFDTDLGRYVAIKALRPELADTLSVERFKREVSMVARLDHPRIVALYDRGEAAGVLYFVMRYVEGQSLRERLMPRKQLEIAEALRIARDVAEALDYAHGQQIVHRDIKPENILLDQNGAHVADFGVARIIDAAGRDRVSQTGIAIGTAQYMSPEQIENSPFLDGRSDVYSLACVLYEMLAGEPPYTSPTRTGILNKHLAAAIPDICVMRPTVPRFMERVLTAALQKSPADRFHGCVAFIDACQQTDATAGRGGSPTVAVLPFANMSGDIANDYFSDGVTEELIGELTRRGGIRVVARTSSFVFKGQQRDIREIGVVLGATHILEGSIRIAGRKLRATAQLVDAATGNQLWSEKFDRDIEDVFAVQDEITDAIVNRLNREFEPVEPKGVFMHAVQSAAWLPEVEGDEEFGTLGRSRFARPEPAPRKSLPDIIISPAPDKKLEAGLREATKGKYTIEGPIGQGPISFVYRAIDRISAQPVAIKILVAQLNADASLRERVRRHAEIAMSLRHPNIVRVEAVVEAPALVYIVMELLEAPSLRERLKIERQLSVEAVMGIVRQVGGALAFAHARNVLHSDLRPESIRIDSNGGVKVAGFGIAAAFEQVNAITGELLVLGTPAYMCPERAMGGEVGPASDQYSLGAIVWEMLAGEQLFSGGYVAQVLLKHIDAPIPDLRGRRPGISSRVARTIARMIAKNPRDRFPTVDAAVRALEESMAADEVPTASDPARLARATGAARFMDWLLRRRGPRPQPGEGKGALRKALPARKRFSAYDAFLRGRYLLNFKPTARYLLEAIQQFDAAINANPTFESAYAARASARIILARAGVGDVAMLRDQATRDAADALELAPSLAEGHVARALGAAFFDWDGKSAVAALERAIASSPAYADAHLWRGFVLNWLEGTPVAAIRSLDRALDLDPLSLTARVELAFAYWMEGDFDQALRQSEDAVGSGLLLGRTLSPLDTRMAYPRSPSRGFAAAHQARAVVLAELGRLDEAIEQAKDAYEFGGHQIVHLGVLGRIHAQRGDRQESEAIIRKLEVQSASGAAVSTALATVYSGLGETDKLLAALNDAYEAREVNLVFVRHSRHFANVRSDPRFQRLLSLMSHETKSGG